MKDSILPTIRIIASILIAAFLAQDIAWAYPSDSNQNLAVTGLKNAQTLNNLKAAMSNRLGIDIKKRDVNNSFGEGASTRHIVTNNLIAFHDKTMCIEGPNYNRRFFDAAIPDERDAKYKKKILEAIRLLREVGSDERGADGLSHAQRADQLENEDTFVIVDMPTRLLLSGIRADGSVFYQLTHIGKGSRIIYLPRKALDKLDVLKARDMRQLATALNHDQLELNLMLRDEKLGTKKTFAEYQESIEEYHGLAKKDDPFGEMYNLESRIEAWVRSEKTIRNLLKEEVDEKAKRFNRKYALITHSNRDFRPSYIYFAAVKAMQIGYAYEAMEDIDRAKIYYDKAFELFIDVTSVDVAMLPIYAQMNIVRLNILAGNYEEAALEFRKILEFKIGGRVPGIHDEVFKQAIAPVLANAFKQWLYEIASLMIERAEESGKSENRKKAYDAIESISVPVFDLLREVENPPSGIASRLLKPMINYNARTGKFGRLISILGGLEEVFYSGILISGVACLMNMPFMALVAFSLAGLLYILKMIIAFSFIDILNNPRAHRYSAVSAARWLGRLKIFRWVSINALKFALENSKFRDVRRASGDALKKYERKDGLISGWFRQLERMSLFGLSGIVFGILINAVFAPGLYSSVLMGLGVASVVYFRSDHSKEVYRLTGGVFKSGPPTGKDLFIITLLGITVRSVYISLLIFLPFGSSNIFIALPAAIIAHSIYNLITPWTLGMVSGGVRPRIKDPEALKAFLRIQREEGLENACKAAIHFLSRGTPGAERLLKMAVTKKGHLQEEFLGEFVEAKSVEDHIKHSKVIELGMERFGPEIDFVLEVNRSKYLSGKGREFELEDGIYLGESKTAGKTDDLEATIEKALSDKVEKYKRVVSNRIKAKELGVGEAAIKGFIFAIGGEVATSEGVEKFNFTQFGREASLEAMGIKKFLALIPDVVMSRGRDKLLHRERLFIDAMIAELNQDGLIDAIHIRSARLVLRAMVINKGIAGTQYSISQALKMAGASPYEKRDRTNKVWAEVFRALGKEAGIKFPVVDFSDQKFIINRERSVNGDTKLKVKYWPEPLKELKNSRGGERCEFEIAGFPGRWVPLIDGKDHIVIAHIAEKGKRETLDDYFVFRPGASEHLLYYAWSEAAPVPVRVPVVVSLDEELTPDLLIGFVKAGVGGARLLYYYGQQLMRDKGRWGSWSLEPGLEDSETAKAVARPFRFLHTEDENEIIFERLRERSRIADVVTLDKNGKFGLIAEFGFHNLRELYQKYLTSLIFKAEQGERLSKNLILYADDIAIKGVGDKEGIADEYQQGIIEDAGLALSARINVDDREASRVLMRLQRILNLMSDSYGKSGQKQPIPGAIYFMLGGAFTMKGTSIKVPAVVKFRWSRKEGRYILEKRNIKLLEYEENLEDMLATSYSHIKEMEKLEPKSSSSDMSNGGYNNNIHGDTANPFIIDHIKAGRAVEIDMREGKVYRIRLDRSKPRAPPIERHFDNSGISDKLRRATDSKLLRRILDTKRNFRFYTSEEKDKLVEIVQNLTVSAILGEAVVGTRYYMRNGQQRRNFVLLHVRDGFSKRIHNLEPTIWIGELQLHRLSAEELALAFVEESQHILKNEKWVEDDTLAICNREDDSFTVKDPRTGKEQKFSDMGLDRPTYIKMRADGHLLIYNAGDNSVTDIVMDLKKPIGERQIRSVDRDYLGGPLDWDNPSSVTALSRKINLHGSVEEAEDPREVVDHDSNLVNDMDETPATGEELQILAPNRPETDARSGSSDMARDEITELMKAIEPYAKKYMHQDGLTFKFTDRGTFARSHHDDIMEIFAKAGVGTGKRYLSLGSGLGDDVLLAAIEGADAIGIEFDRQLYDDSVSILGDIRDKAWFRDAKASFKNGDYIDKSVDFSKYDILYWYYNEGDILGRALNDQELQIKLADPHTRFKPGTKVIVTGTGSWHGFNLWKSGRTTGGMFYSIYVADENGSFIKNERAGSSDIARTDRRQEGRALNVKEAEDRIKRVCAAEKDEILFKYGRLPDDDPITRYVRKVFEEALGDEAKDYNIIVAPEWYEINAAAFIDGTIVVSRALLEFIRYKQELAAVLAHEAVHIKRRHAEVIARAGDEGSGVVDAVLSTIGLMRLHEYEADMHWMLEEIGKRRVNPMGLVVFLERLEDVEKSRNAGYRQISWSHGGLEDRALNAESIFYFLDMPSLSKDLEDIPDKFRKDLAAKKRYDRVYFWSGVDFLEDEELKTVQKERIQTVARISAGNLHIALNYIMDLISSTTKRIKAASGDAKKMTRYKQNKRLDVEIFRRLLARVDCEILSEKNYPDPKERSLARCLFYHLFFPDDRFIGYISGEPVKFASITKRQEEDMRLITTAEDIELLPKVINDSSVIFPEEAMLSSPDILFEKALYLFINKAGLDKKPSAESVKRFIGFARDLSVSVQNFYDRKGGRHVVKKKKLFNLAVEILGDEMPAKGKKLKNLLKDEAEKTGLLGGKTDSEGSKTDFDEPDKKKSALLEKLSYEGDKLGNTIFNRVSIHKRFKLRDYRDVLQRICRVVKDDELDIDMAIRFYNEIDPHISWDKGSHDLYTMKLRLVQYVKFRLFEAMIESMKKFRELPKTQKNVLKLDALNELAYQGSDLSLSYGKSGKIILVDSEEEKLMGEYFAEFDSPDGASILSNSDKLYVEDIKKNAEEKWLNSDPTMDQMIKLYEYITSSAFFSPTFPRQSVSYQIFTRILAKYFSKCSGWKQFFSDMRSMEASGVPVAKMIADNKDAFSLALGRLWGYMPKNPDKNELEEIRIAISFVESPFLKMQLQAYYYEKIWPVLGFKEKLDLMFSAKGEGFFDLKKFNEFVEKEAKTEEELHLTLEALKSKFNFIMGHGSRESGLAAIMSNFKFRDPKEAQEMLMALLRTHRSDEKLRGLLYEWCSSAHSASDVDELDDGDIVRKKAEVRNSLRLAEKIIRLIYIMDSPAKYILLRKFLTGEFGLLSNIKNKPDFLKELIDVTVSKKGYDNLNKILEETLGAIGNVPSWKQVYFALQSVIADRIAVMPEATTPWDRVGAVESYLSLFHDPETEEAIFRPKEMVKGIAIDNIDQASYTRYPWRYEREFAFYAEKVLRNRLEELGHIQAPPRSTELTALSFIIEFAQKAGALGVRFLQLLPQFISDMPESYREEFSKVYDSVYGQSKLTALATLEREWPAVWSEIASIDERVGGGSLMTVYRVKTKSGKDEVVKVLNPNLEYHLENNVKFINEIISELEKRHGDKYRLARAVLEDVRSWIKKDVNFADFLEKDNLFREQNNGFTYEGLGYQMLVPRSYGPKSRYFMREEFVAGRNLTEWKELQKEGHDLKAIISLIIKNYVHQLEKGMVHSDVHIGNFRVTADNNIAILDRNFFLELTPETKDLIDSLLNPLSLFSLTPELLLDKLLAITKTEISAGQRKRLIASINSFIKDIKNGKYDSIGKLLVDLRAEGVKFPVELTLIFKNINSLQEMAHHAGFNNIVEAYLYTKEEGSPDAETKSGSSDIAKNDSGEVHQTKGPDQTAENEFDEWAEEMRKFDAENEELDIADIADESLPYGSRVRAVNDLFLLYDVDEANLKAIMLLDNWMIRENIFEQKLGDLWAALAAAGRQIMGKPENNMTEEAKAANRRLLDHISRRMRSVENKLTRLTEYNGFNASIKRQALPEDIYSEALDFGEAIAEASPGVELYGRDSAKGKTLILYADDILERGSAADLAYTLNDATILNGSTMFLYGKKPGMADLLEKIINSSGKNRDIKTIKIAPEDMQDMNGGREINLEFADEAKEFDLLLRHISARYHVNNGMLLGVIKGRTGDAYVDGIKTAANGRHVPVVLFEHVEHMNMDKEVYSFREALSCLLSIEKDVTSLAGKRWYRFLKPIEREDIERAYQDYRRALEVAINA